MGYYQNLEKRLCHGPAAASLDGDRNAIFVTVTVTITVTLWRVLSLRPISRQSSATSESWRELDLIHGQNTEKLAKMVPKPSFVEKNEDTITLQEIDTEQDSSSVPVSTTKQKGKRSAAGSEAETPRKKVQIPASPKVKQEKAEANDDKAGSKKTSREATPQDANPSRKGCSSPAQQEGGPSGSGGSAAECSAPVPVKKDSKRNPGLPPRPPASNKKKSEPQIKVPQVKAKNKKTVRLMTPASRLPACDAPADLAKLCEGMPQIYLKPVNWGIPVKKEEKKPPPRLIPRPLQRELKTIVIDGEVFEPPKKIPEELVQVSFLFVMSNCTVQACFVSSFVFPAGLHFLSFASYRSLK